MQKIDGYHYAQSTDGAFAVEVDQPCEGVVTVNWKPQEYPGAAVTFELPQALFLPVIQSYIAERNATKSPRK